MSKITHHPNVQLLARRIFRPKISSLIGTFWSHSKYERQLCEKLNVTLYSQPSWDARFYPPDQPWKKTHFMEFKKARKSRSFKIDLCKLAIEQKYKIINDPPIVTVFFSTDYTTNPDNESDLKEKDNDYDLIYEQVEKIYLIDNDTLCKELGIFQHPLEIDTLIRLKNTHRSFQGICSVPLGLLNAKALVIHNDIYEV